MMRLVGKYLVLLSLALTLGWGGFATDARADVSFDGAITLLSAGHDHGVAHHDTAEPSHLAHHGCHSHLSMRSDGDSAMGDLAAMLPAYLAAAATGLHGRAVGPAIKPPAVL